MSARQLSDAHVGRSKSELLAQRTFSAAVVAAITRPSVRWRIAPRHRTCWSRVPWAATCNRVRARLLAHRWLFRVADRRYTALFAPRQAFLGTSPAWLVAAFECIHRYEGAWTDSGDPYWGGLQFGASEWRRFGSRYAATANLATPAQQIAAGIAYYHADGDSFAPWPTTARACGLL